MSNNTGAASIPIQDQLTAGPPGCTTSLPKSERWKNWHSWPFTRRSQLQETLCYYANVLRTTASSTPCFIMRRLLSASDRPFSCLLTEVVEHLNTQTTMSQSSPDHYNTSISGLSHASHTALSSCRIVHHRQSQCCCQPKCWTTSFSCKEILSRLSHQGQFWDQMWQEQQVLQWCMQEFYALAYMYSKSSLNKYYPPARVYLTSS